LPGENGAGNKATDCMDMTMSLLGRVTLCHLESRGYPSIPETALRWLLVRAVIFIVISGD